MKRYIILLALMGVMLAVSPSTAQASHTGEGSVSATVTPAVVSVGLSGGVDYGAVHLNGTDLLPSPLFFTATNNGNVTVDLDIKGGNSTTGTTPWSIGATADADQFVHTAASDSGFTTSVVVLNTSNQAFVSGIATSDTVDVYLKLDAPTSSTVNDEQTLPITIIATAA